MEATGSVAPALRTIRVISPAAAPANRRRRLFEYVPDNALVFADESHVTVPQIGGMFKGDFRRKATLAEYGFRLPSCMDNRPLRFEEWDMMRPQSVAVSATPAAWEINESRRRLRRAGHPPDRADRSPDPHPSRRARRSMISSARSAPRRNAGYRSADHRADQADGGRPHRISARARHPRALHAFSDIDTIERIEIIRDLQARRVRCAGRHQPVARGSRHSRMRAGRHSRRRQGRLSAQRDLADPDHRPRRAQRRRQGHPLCRQHDGIDGRARSPRPIAAARSRSSTIPSTASRRRASRNPSAIS